MSSIISIGSRNIVNNGLNNQFSYQLTNSSAMNFRNTEIALASIQMYNSQFNISSSFNNNQFIVDVPIASNVYQAINITLPDGWYSIGDINNFIKLRLIAEGAYLIDNNQENVVFIRLRENASYYAAELNCQVVPTTLPAGWSQPATGIYSSSLPSTARTMRLIVPNNNFQKSIGFNAGSYPPEVSPSNVSFLSQFSPQIHPTSSYLLRCNIVKNSYGSPSDILYAFSRRNVGFGQIIDISPSEYSWISIPDGSYATITLSITDQNGANIRLEDPNTLISLLIRQRK